MERGDESGEGGAETSENLWEKLRRVGKRGGHSTPAASFWRTNQLGLSANSQTGSGTLHHATNFNEAATNFGIISSRKLAAALWELHQYKLPLDNMRRRPHKDTSFQLPESSRNPRRHVAELVMQHHRAIEKSNRATKTVSPSTCSSSTEIAPCNPATPSSSIELKGRNGELANGLRASTELLKVLNRVWSLEEQHVSNMSLIKALKKELDRARFHAKELVREQQGGRNEMDEVMKHITGGQLLRKNKEQDRINARVQCTRDELENERQLRKQSESLQRKLAQELYEVRSSLARISDELGKERTSRGLLEDLCDELAWGLRDCEKELHDQRQKSGKDMGERDDHDQLILRISQAWLDERMRVKQSNEGEKVPTIQNERNSKAKILGNPMYQESSLESIPLNLGTSARREEDDYDGSSSSHSNCFEVDKTSEYSLKLRGQTFQENHFEEMLKEKEFMEKLESSDRTRALSPSRLQAKFEEHMARAMSYAISKNQVEDVEHKTVGQGNPGNTKGNISEDKHESKGISELDSNYEINNLIRNYYSFSENGMQINKDRVMASSLGRSFQSPVHEWTEKLPAQDLDTSEAKVKFLPELKESTLREKLFEARSGGQKSRSCQKASIYPSRD